MKIGSYSFSIWKIVLGAFVMIGLGRLCAWLFLGVTTYASRGYWDIPEYLSYWYTFFDIAFTVLLFVLVFMGKFGMMKKSGV